MEFNFAPAKTVDELSEIEAEIDRLRQEQQAIIDRNRTINDEIMKANAKLREAQARKAEEARLERIRAEQEALRKEQEENDQKLANIIAKLEALELVSWEKAHPYQKEDIISTYLNYVNGENGFFNANDMGLGKTFEAISFLEIYFKENPDANCLWLSKSSIVETGGTRREIQKWSDIKVVEILGRTPKDQREFTVELLSSMKGLILITNYETLRTTQSLQKSSFDVVVMDEVHKLKGGANPSGPTGMWSAVKNYIWDNKGTKENPIYEQNVKYTLMLSGTPMVNRVAELWSYLHIFDPERFNSLKSFERSFNAYVEYGGKVNTDKILEICLKDRMVRRTRKEVGLQLPEYTEIIQEVQLNPKQEEIYEQMRRQFFIWLDEQHEEALTATAIIAQLIRLRQIVAWPVFKQKRVDEFGQETFVEINVPDSAKIDECMDLIEEANDQVVVFCNFNDPMEEVQRRCKERGLRCEIIRGSTKKNMNEYEVGFQNGEIDVLCINSSMGEGLNLQKNPDRWDGGAAVGIHLDLWWNPARDEQCNARIYRQGANQPVTIYKIHAPGTVDDFVKAISDEKAELFEGIMSDQRIRPAVDWKKQLEGMI